MYGDKAISLYCIVVNYFLIKMPKELCPNCGSKYFHESNLTGYYFCEACQEEMIYENLNYYICDVMGYPEGDALKNNKQGFVFR